MPKKIKAGVLLSGGLDSMLAIKILEAQGINVTAICFVSNFFSADKARTAAKELNVPLKVIDISKELLEVVKHPPCGHGKCLNPCIDCHALMVARTAAVAKKESFDIIATGEVLGQRPMSQNKRALARVEKIAGIEILRPLSAKLLPETIYEKNGKVDRKRLLDISGRSRERQIKLAKKFGIKDYPSPAGGCLLTEIGFSDRLAEMLKYWPKCTSDDVELLKNGRVYWIYGRILIVVGRNAKDNENLQKLAKKGDILVELSEINGPFTLVRLKDLDLRITKDIWKIKIPKELNLEKIKEAEDPLKNACLLTGYHAPKMRGEEAEFEMKIKKIKNYGLARKF